MAVASSIRQKAMIFSVREKVSSGAARGPRETGARERVANRMLGLELKAPD